MSVGRESKIFSISGGATSPGAENRIIPGLFVAPPEIVKRRIILYRHAAPLELENRSLLWPRIFGIFAEQFPACRQLRGVPTSAKGFDQLHGSHHLLHAQLHCCALIA